MSHAGRRPSPMFVLALFLLAVAAVGLSVYRVDGNPRHDSLVMHARKTGTFEALRSTPLPVDAQYESAKTVLHRDVSITPTEEMGQTRTKFSCRGHVCLTPTSRLRAIILLSRARNSMQSLDLL